MTRSLLPKGTGRRRAVDKVAELRDENRRLLTITHRAGDDIALLRRDLADEQERRKTAEKELQQAEEVIRLRDREIADLKRKVDVGVKAEHVIAKTQELSVDEIRKHCVMPLHQAPFATTDPGRT
ncbi:MULTISPECIES: hypothetical protein [unclassified Streptomyces]|uniref:hypothetical protein n=1 Tax=unclassified Streptomyces TaxID=2593676 RepID=UPI00148916E3|nr:MULTISPECIES: hypothetical protein [unclassified Streptomyces]